MVIKEYYTISEAAEILDKNPETLRRWDNEGKLSASREPMSNYRVYKKTSWKYSLNFRPILKMENIAITLKRRMSMPCWNSLPGLAVLQLEWKRLD